MLMEPSASEQGRGVERRFEPSIGAPGGGYAVSALLAIGIHVGVLFGWPKGRPFEPAEYGVVRGESAMEVALIVASPISEDEPAESNEPAKSHKPMDEVEEESDPEPVPAPAPHRSRLKQCRKYPNQSRFRKPSPSNTEQVFRDAKPQTEDGVD